MLNDKVIVVKREVEKEPVVTGITVRHVITPIKCVEIVKKQRNFAQNPLGLLMPVKQLLHLVPIKLVRLPAVLVQVKREIRIVRIEHAAQQLLVVLLFRPVRLPVALARVPLKTGIVRQERAPQQPVVQEQYQEIYTKHQIRVYVIKVLLWPQA